MPPLPIADLASGVTGAFGICAADPRARRHRRRHVPRRVHDRRDGDVDRARREDRRASHDERPPQAVPGYGLFTTADGRQVALGVVNEEHFWTRLCAVLGLGDLAGLDFAERSARGDELQRAVRAAVTTRQRDELVADAERRRGAGLSGPRPRRRCWPRRPSPASRSGCPSRSPPARCRGSISIAGRVSARSGEARLRRALLRCRPTIRDEPDRRPPDRQPWLCRGTSPHRGPAPEPPPRRGHLHGCAHRRLRRPRAPSR